MTEIFGPLISDWHVEQAVQEHLQTWQETYLAEIERQNGLDPRALPKFRSWEIADEMRKWPEAQLPAAVIVSEGIRERPQREGDGTYRARYQVQVTAVASAKTQTATDKLAKLYSIAQLAAILQHPSVGDIARGVTWLRSANRSLPMDDEHRTLAAAGHLLSIEIGDILNARAGLAEPPADPYAVPADLPTVEATEISVEKEDEEP